MSGDMTLESLLKQEIDDLLDETFEQVKGIYLDRGTSLFETLSTISAGEASIPVSATCSSIAGQVEHVRFYLEVLLRYMRGEEVEEIDWGASWRLQSVSPDEWSELIDRLRAAYRDVRELTAGIDDWLDEDQLSGVLSIIVHTAYHLGEIRQALCTVAGSSR